MSINFYWARPHKNVYVETYFLYVADKNPRYAAQKENGHLWMGTN